MDKPVRSSPLPSLFVSPVATRPMEDESESRSRPMEMVDNVTTGAYVQDLYMMIDPVGRSARRSAWTSAQCFGIQETLNPRKAGPTQRRAWPVPLLSGPKSRNCGS